MKTIKQLMNLENRTAIVTGGLGHIGNAVASALYESGANIIILDLENKDKVNTSPYKYFHLDLSNKVQLVKVVKDLEKEFSCIDILINCAALVGTSNLDGWGTSLSEQNIDTWQKCFDINLSAPFQLVQCCLSLLSKSRGASIINIGSMYGFVGQKPSMYESIDYITPAAYAASKGGLLQLTRYLATTLCPNIRVNSISPGGIIRNQDEDFIKRYEALTPLGRMGTEEDIKGAALFLASDLSKYVTGQNIVVDGGWSV